MFHCNKTEHVIDDWHDKNNDRTHITNETEEILLS